MLEGTPSIPFLVLRWCSQPPRVLQTSSPSTVSFAPCPPLTPRTGSPCCLVPTRCSRSPSSPKCRGSQCVCTYTIRYSEFRMFVESARCVEVARARIVSRTSAFCIRIFSSREALDPSHSSMSHFREPCSSPVPRCGRYRLYA